jgi:hypothetical protein
MSIIELEIICIVALIVMAGLISCFETAITASSRAKIHRLENEGDKRAKRLEHLLKNREKVVSVMLLANNAISIIASALTTKFLLDIFGKIGVLYSTVFLTIAVIIFGEILPKTIAIQSPEKCALIFCRVIEFLYKIFAPIVAIIQKIIDFSIGIFQSKKIAKTNESELEEISDIVDLKAKEGSIFKYDKDLLDGVLDLSDTEISEIMVHRKDIESINRDLKIAEILKKAIDIGYTRIPIWQGNKENIISILNVRKLLKALYFYKGDIEKFNLDSVLTAPFFSPNSNTLHSQLFAFRKQKRRLALVIDEYGSLQGLVTLEDILEEIVGEIKEPDENNEFNIIKTKSGIYKIAGKTLIRDLNKKLDLDIEEQEEAHNISAYIINHLGRIPEEKESFVIDKLSFEILRKKSNDLLLIKLKNIAESDKN